MQAPAGADLPVGDGDLIAPLNTIDVGEAGIRVSGNVNVAALHVVNAANIQVQGDSKGIPVTAVVNTGALASASAASSAAFGAAEYSAQRERQQARQNQPSVISVQILGYGEEPLAGAGAVGRRFPYPEAGGPAPGAAVVVLDATPAAAVFARLAQAEVAHPRALPRSYFLLELRVPAAAVAEPRPPAGWQSDLQASRAFGNAWLARGDTLLLKVPSAAGGCQYLLNADHPLLAQCQIVSSLAYPFAPHLAGIEGAVLDGAGWLACAHD